MKVIHATVLDPTHLELTEPLALRSGARVAVAVSEERNRSTDADEGERQPPPAPQPLPFRRRENEWRRTHGGVLRGYAGEWVVLEGEEIVVHGDDPAQLVKEARERGIRSPYVFYVEPPQPGAVTIGL